MGLLLSIDFASLHQILRNLYQDMMPLCTDMIGIAKGVAGLGALFYVAYRVWKSLASGRADRCFPIAPTVRHWTLHYVFPHGGTQYD